MRGVVDTGRVNRAISDAGAEIDSYCLNRYKVPFTTVPPMIRKSAVAIAIYNLFQGKHGAPEDRRTDYKDTISWLSKVLSGDAGIGVQPEPDTPEEASATAIKSNARPQIFSPSTMEKY